MKFGDYITTVVGHGLCYEIYYLSEQREMAEPGWIQVLAICIEQQNDLIIIWKNMFPYIPSTHKPVVLKDTRTFIFPTRTLTVTHHCQLIYGTIK